MMSEMKNWKNENYECTHLRFQSAPICVNYFLEFLSQIYADSFSLITLIFRAPLCFICEYLREPIFFFSQINIR
jgi:hypothetical protein